MGAEPFHIEIPDSKLEDLDRRVLQLHTAARAGFG
jgi:hypothetical protein